VRVDDLAPGADLPERTFGPVTRTSLALFAGASGDHNAVHVDVDAARAAGFDDVFAHGMLTMALLGAYVESLARPGTLTGFSTRFVARTPVGASPTCSGRVVDRDGRRTQLELEVRLGDGTVTATGRAEISEAVAGAVP